MIARLLLILAAMLIGSASFAGAARAADAVTPAQREAVEQIVHDYLLKHPEVIIQSLQAAEDRAREAADARAKEAVAQHQRELLDDPASPVGGNPKGDVTIVEFFDYRCPYCKEVEPALEALLRQDGRIRIVYKEYPVLGPASVYATRVALAARKQGKYGAFHDAMMATKGTIDADVVMQVARSAGLDVERLKADMAAPEIDALIKRNYALADALQIHGTPAFVIGGEMVPGAIDIATLREKIAAARKG